MRLARAVAAILVLAIASPAVARTVAQSDLDQNNFKLYGLPTYDRDTGAVRLLDNPKAVANVAALEALPGGIFHDGVTVRVTSLRRNFVFRTSSLTVDHITVCSVSGVGGSRWINDVAREPTWWSTTAWWVDPAAGNDENAGTSSGTALKTFGEFSRRLYGATLPSGTINVTLMSSAPASDVLHMTGVTSDGFVLIAITGTPTVIATPAASAAHNAASASANDHYSVTVTGASGFTQNYLLHRTNGTQVYAWGYKVVTGNELQTSVPLTSSLSVGTWATSDAIEVLSLPDFPDAWVEPPTPFMSISLKQVRLIGSSFYGASGTWGQVEIDRSIIPNPFSVVFGGSQAVFTYVKNVCVPSGAAPTFQVSGSWSIWGGLFAGNGTTSQVTLSTGYSLGGTAANTLTLGGISVGVTHDFRFEKLAVMSYDWTGAGAVVSATHHSWVGLSSIGGEGNTGPLVSAETGSIVMSNDLTNFANWNSAVTTNTVPYLVNANTYSAAQLGVDTNQVAVAGSGIVGLTKSWSGDLSGLGINPTVVNNAITNAKLADMPTARFKARITAGTSDPEDITGTQATTLLDAFTSTLKGLAPASGGGTANFLRADGTWATPSGTGAPTSATYITQTPDATLSAEQALSGLGSGVMQSLTGTGVVSTFAATANRLVFGSGSNGQLADDADLTYASDVLTLANSDGSGFSMALTKAGTQTIEKRGSGTFFVGTLGLQDLGLYTNNTTRLTIASTGSVSIPNLGTPGGYVQAAASSGLLSSAVGVPGTDLTGFGTGLIPYGNGTGLTTTSTLGYNTSQGGITVGIAPASIAAATVAHLKLSSAIGTNLYVENPNSGTGSYMGLTIGNNDTIFTGPYFGFWQTGASFSTVGFANASAAWFQLGGGSGNIWYDLRQNAGDHIFSTTTSGTERFRIANAGLVTFGGSSVAYLDESLPAAGAFVIGNGSTVPSNAFVQFNKNANSANYVIITNPNTGANAEAGFFMNLSATAYTNYAFNGLGGSNMTTQAGFYTAKSWLQELVNDNGAAFIFAQHGTGDFNWRTTTSDTLRMTLKNAGDLQLLNSPSATFSSGAAVSLVAPTVVEWAISPPTTTAAASLPPVHSVDAYTLTLSGGTTTASTRGTGFFKPTITDASAHTSTRASTVWIQGAPVAAGSETFTSKYALDIEDGVLRLGGVDGATDVAIKLDMGDDQKIEKTGSDLYIGTGDNEGIFFYTNATNKMNLSSGGELGLHPGSTQSWYNVGQPGTANYERVRAYWNSNTFRIDTEKGGTGSYRTMEIRGLATLNLFGGPAFTAQIQLNDASMQFVDANTIASGASATNPAFDFSGGTTLTGSTSITTAAGFNFVTFHGPTYGDSGGTVAVIDRAATVAITGGPQPTTGVTAITDVYALWTQASKVRFDGVVEQSKGGDLTSANDMVMGVDGNFFNVTGNTQINTMTYAGTRHAGTVVTLVFASNPVVKHNTAGTGAKFDLSGNVDYATAAGAKLTVVYDGTNWNEIGRSAP